jgi:hypothetical protein
MTCLWNRAACRGAEVRQSSAGGCLRGIDELESQVVITGVEQRKLLVAIDYITGEPASLTSLLKLVPRQPKSLSFLGGV